MRPRPWMQGSVAICLVTALNCAYAIDAAELAQAHELIVSFGGQVCAAVSTDATSRTTEVGGEIGLKLDGLFKKLVGLDVGLSGKSITAETRGILQSDIAKALQDRNECYLHVFDVVVKQVLRPVPPDPEARRMSGRWRSDGMKSLAFLNVVARGNRLFGTEFSESGAPYITYEGTVSDGVFEGTAYMEKNLNPNKDEILIPERKVLAPAQLQLSQDGRHLYGHLTITLNGGRQMASKLDYSRDQ
jgi:hypothetical protein